MPKCDNCAKGPLYGNNRPWSNKATRRHWHPNIQKIKVMENGRKVSKRLCTSCIKSLSR
ncbi:MAG: 50S ribosomal protein L28 [Caldilineaceae bacterium]|nr:50S ribosomal protein L28 [Caldilineaceae bacterium]